MERTIADELYSDIFDPRTEVGQISIPGIDNSHSPDEEEEQWCEDGSTSHSSNRKFDPSSDLDREWLKRKNQFHAIGYRDGIIAGTEASAQEGFNVGFKESVVAGFNWGLVRGVTGALDCLPNELREKITESQETRNKFRHLHESVNNLSTTDALKFFHDNHLKRSVKQGDKAAGSLLPTEQQTSDISVLSGYYRQLQSLLAESPAIEVQLRDNANDILSTSQDPSLR